MEIVKDVAGPNVLLSNNLLFSVPAEKYLTDSSDPVKQPLLVNWAKRALSCNKLRSWCETKQTSFLVYKLKLKLEPRNGGAEF